MSIYGALNTAISGLTAQASAFANISDNVANAQTVGFKRVDTSFVDFLTTSSNIVNDPGAVVARPDYANTVQGTITQTDKPLNMAIAGQGFFTVSEPIGNVTSGVTTFSPQPFYTRAGDFATNKEGYLVNSAGLYLNGWPVDPTTGAVNQNVLQPIQVTQTVFNPVATSSVQLNANLPATPAAGTATLAAPLSSAINVYDALGTVHPVSLDWVQNAPGDWTVNIASSSLTPAAIGSAEVTFGAASGNPVPAGTIGQIFNTTGAVSAAGYAPGTSADMAFTVDFGSGPQTIDLGMGTYGVANGVTQYAGTTYSLAGLTQNGVPPGSFSSLITQADGSVIVNYNNGQSRTIAQVPITTFNAADQLQRQNGQAFTATLNSGNPIAEIANTNGAGTIVVSSTEGSNVDIASEFSQLIVAQQAYSANAKMVTTANQLLTTTIDMKQ